MALLAALLAAAFALALGGFFPQRPLHGLAERRLRAAFGPGARIGSLHVLPAGLSVVVADLVLDGPGYSLEVPRASLKLSLDSLLGRALSLERAELERPRLVLRPAAATKAGPTAQALTKPVLVRSLQVRGASLTYDDPSLGGPVTLRGIELRGGLGEGTLELRVAGGTWERPKPVMLGPASARVRVTPRLDLRLESFEAGIATSRVSAAGGLGSIGSIRLDLDLGAHVDLAEIAALAGTPPMAGTLAAKGHADGDLAALRADVTLEGRGLGVAGWSVDAAALRLKRDANRTAVSLGADLLGGRADGEVRFDGSMLDGRLRLAAIDAERLRRKLAAGAPPVEGTLSGELSALGRLEGALGTRGSLTASGKAGTTAVRILAEASGALRPSDRSVDLRWTAALQAEGGGRDRPRFEAARVAVSGTASGPWPPAIAGVIEGTLGLDTLAGAEEVSLGGRVRSRGGEAEVSLEAHGLGGRLSATVETRAGSPRLALRADAVRLDPLAAGTSGRASLSLEVTGPAARPSGRGRAQVDDLGLRGVEVGTATAGFEASEGRAQGTLAVPALNVTGQGQLRLGPHADVTGTLSLAATPLSVLAPLMPRGLALDGRTSGRVDITVPLARPETAEVRAQIDALEAQSGRFSARATRPLALTFRDRRLSIEDLGLEGPGFTLAAGGSLGLDPQAPADVHVLADVDLTRLPAPEGWTLAGTARADVTLAGHTARPQARGAVTARDLRVETRVLPPLRVAQGRVELDGDAVVVPDLTVSVAGGSLTASGRVPLAAVLASARSRAGPPVPAEQATLEVAWEGVEAAALLERLRPGEPAAADASLAGRARFEGGLGTLEELRGRVSVPATTLHLPDLALEVEPFDVQLDRGGVRTDGITLTGEGGRFRIAGGVDLARGAVDVSGKGTLQLRALSPFLAAASLTGTAEVDLAVGGTSDAPRPRGTLLVRDVTVRVRDIPQALAELEGSVVFDEGSLRIERASAVLGGGPVTISGSASLSGKTLADVRVALAGRDMALRYPPGLKSRLGSDLTLTGRSGAFLLSGKVEAVRGLYDLDVAVEETLLAPTVAPVESPLLRSFGLAIDVEIVNPVRVHNNLADLRASGRLVMRGTMGAPEPYGRLEIEPGGQVFVQGQEFRIVTGHLDYAATWNADVAIEAERRIRDSGQGGSEYLVKITVEGALETLSLQSLRFATQPELSQEQIRSLIATGTTEKTLTGAKLAGVQAATLATARLGREVSRGLSGLGLGQVTLRPELLARETDPGARFTFESQITRAVSLIYSVGLNDAEARFVQLQARSWRDLRALIQRRDDGTVTYGAGQRLTWGGAGKPAASEEARVRLADLRLEGDRPLPEREMRGALRARPGRSVLAWDLQDDADRLRERLRRAGYLEAEVGARLDGLVAVFAVRSGAEYRWRVEGMSAPPDLSGEMRKALFEEEALERGTARLLGVLRDRGHLRAQVTAKAVDQEARRTLVFSVTPGPLLAVAEVSFPGATVLAESRLLRAAGGAAALLTAPDEAVKAIRAEYQRRHFLAAEVERPRVREAGGSVRIVVPVREGGPARIGSVRFEGATLPEQELARRIDLAPGSPVSEVRVAAAAERLHGHYLTRGYASSRVAAEIVPVGADVDVVFRVSEGERVTIGAVEVAGRSRTRESIVRRQIDLHPGDPLDPRRIAALERRLLNLGLFSRAAVTASGNPATVRVEVEEGPRLVGEYEVRYSDAEHTTAVLDAERRNLFGVGLDLGGRYKVGADIREIRPSLHLRSLLGGQVTASFFRIEEDLPAFDLFTQEPITNVRLRRGADVQHRSRLGGEWDLLVGYLFRRVSLTLNPEPLTVASLRLSAVRDTRDSPLDARHGRFLSVSVELAPKALASDFTFLKGFAQAFLTRPVGGAFTWAQGYRLGLAHGFGGQTLIFDDRFKAGGDGSLRGFATDSVGPKDFLGEPDGGQAAVILNQELRYRHASGLGAALFYDVGNVFETVDQMKLDFRHDLGLGLRYASPVGLLRLDLGVPLGRREGEKRARVFFSLGQAF